LVFRHVSPSFSATRTRFVVSDMVSVGCSQRRNQPSGCDHASLRRRHSAHQVGPQASQKVRRLRPVFVGAAERLTALAHELTLAFGAYPEVSLSEARKRRDAAKRQLRDGSDPGVVVKEEKQAAAASTANSFRAVSAEWYKRKMVAEHKSPGTLRRAEWLLATLNEGIGDLAMSEIEAPLLLDVLRRVEAAEQHETVKRLRATASSVFRYGIATGRCKRDPAADLRGATTAAVSTPRPAILDPAGVGELLRAIDGYQRRPLLRFALQLLALNFTRPGNICSAEWNEIENGVWSIPAHKMKMRTEFRIPLSRQSLAVLDELRKATNSKKYLFESLKPARPIGTNQLNRALEEIGYTSTRNHS
jgi:integrase